MALSVKEFGRTKGGQMLSLYTLTNKNGMQVSVTDLGATIVSVIVQDKNENYIDVVLGYDGPEGYYAHGGYLGAVIGRNGNRIDKGRFTIDGVTYQLDINDNENNLHSGKNGFDLRKWEVDDTADDSVTFALTDDDMEQGYPGTFKVRVTYILTDENALKIHYQGSCDKDTVANMTNHAYFNLGGHNCGTILDNQLWLNAKYYTPVRDNQAIPTGEIAPVEGTPMDFTTAKPIGRDIEADFEQLHFVGGYDHNFVVAKDQGTIKKIAEAYSPATGVCMEVFSDLPGVQFYAGNFIDPESEGKNGAIYNKRHGFCLESQFYPNAINQEGFASPLLKAGDQYDTMTVYKFSGR